MTKPDQNRTALLGEALRMVAGVVLLTALFVAPLNYGSTRLLPFQTLVALVACGGGAWLLAGALAGTLPLPPRPAQLGVVLIALSAAVWLLVLAVPEAPAFTQAHLARIVRRWPNSVVPRDFSTVLAWSGALVVGLLALGDLCRDFMWRRATAAVILLAGVAVAALGLLQNATGARGIYWEQTHRMPGAFFGTFYHHTSAGAYLNTVWPLGLALALLGLQRTRRSPRLLLLICGSLAAVLLVFVAHTAHISRLPQLLATGALAGFGLWAGIWHALGQVRGLRLSLLVVTAGLVVAVVTLGASRLGTIADRWDQLQLTRLIGGQPAVALPPASEWPRLMRDDLFVPSDHRDYPLGDRGAGYAAALAAIADRPAFGWGPGGWTAAAAAHSADPFVRTFFLHVQFTHNDLLQTAVEWGLLGALGWVLLVPAGVVHALRQLGAQPSRDYLAAGAVVALVAVFAQSTIDFPLQIPAIQFNVIALSALAWTAPVARTARIGVSSFSRT